MRADGVTAPEVTSFAGAGGLVRTHETVAMFEVGVPVPLDLSEVRVPVTTVSDPAENRRFPAEVGDRPIAVFVITAASFINAAPDLAVVEDPGASSRLQDWYPSGVLNRHLGDMVTRKSLKSTEGNRGTLAFPMPFRNTGRRRNGTR